MRQRRVEAQARQRRWWLGAWILTLGACATSNAYLRPPSLHDRYSRYLSSSLGQLDAPPACPDERWSLGEVQSPRIKRFPLDIGLPEGFAADRTTLPRDSVWYAGLGARVHGEVWLPGVVIDQDVSYRWTRLAPDPTPAGEAQHTLIELTERHTTRYPVFGAARPWTVEESSECLLPMKNRTARVLRLTLRHPQRPAQWVVAATWWGLPDRGAISLLAIGPDPAVQAEILAVLRGLEP